MKDITITAKALRRELLVMLGCFVAGVLVNVYAILHYSRPAVELVSQIGYTIVVSIVIYILLLVVRLIVWLIKMAVKKLLLG